MDLLGVRDPEVDPVSGEAAEPSRSVLRQDVSDEELRELRELARTVEAELRGTDDGIRYEGMVGDRERAASAGERLGAMVRRLFQECTRLGPPSPLAHANAEDNRIILVCSHDPQHRYGLDGTPLN